MGHLSDIGFAGALSSAAMLGMGPRRRYIAVLGVPTVLSIAEILKSYLPETNIDWQDMACYYAVALFSYGVNRICDAVSRR